MCREPVRLRHAHTTPVHRSWVVVAVSEELRLEELAALLGERRRSRGLSLRAAAAEAGVALATFSRVESGRVPDLLTFQHLVRWLGVEPERFFPSGPQRTSSTVELVAHHLRMDPLLPPHAAETLSQLVQQMYATLVRPAAPVQVHLRSHHTFEPAAANLLGTLLEQMQGALLDGQPDQASLSPATPANHAQPTDGQQVQ